MINIEETYNECIKYANQIKNDDLRKCCLEVLADHKEMLETRPATIDKHHHYYPGGLLFHSYCVTRNALGIAFWYPDNNIDLDLIIFGGLLHDIGKCYEHTPFDENGEAYYNENYAALFTHCYTGTHTVSNYLDKYNLEINFKNQALHMIGSHMNDFSDWGDITSAKMLEVVIINLGDAMDAKLEPAAPYINNAQKGDLYKIINAPIEYYKSLNPSYEDSKKR